MGITFEPKAKKIQPTYEHVCHTKKNIYKLLNDVCNIFFVSIFQNFKGLFFVFELNLSLRPNEIC